MTIEESVRLIAGTFILASLLLGYYVNEMWFFFTAFVGINLIQSSFTKWCLMSIILKKVGVKAHNKEGCAC